MKMDKEIGLDFLIDKLTNSIENVVTGDSFPTNISIIMKTKSINLDVDYIGGQGSLTVEEEQALSNYFKQKKSISKKSVRIKHNNSTKSQPTNA